ncbi:MAG: GNAT family N-acetyltransferase [Chloroflexi bacterium]|nr:GNAT family N-acetyltransferase [Chloroflexota bacterium]
MKAPRDRGIPMARAPCPRGYRWRAFALYVLYQSLLQVRGYRIRLAQTDQERDQVYRLRWQVYTEAGYLDPARFPDGRFRDRADAVSFSWLAWWKGEPVGTVRATPLKYGIAPVFEYVHDLEEVRAIQDRALELGRYAIVRAHRKGLIGAGLLLRAFVWAIRRAYAYLVWGASRSVTPRVREFSPEMREIPIAASQLRPTDILGYFRKHPQVSVYIVPTCRFRFAAWLRFLAKRVKALVP